MNRTKGLCILGITLLLAATPAFANKVKKLSVGAPAGYDSAPVVVVYSSSGEKWDRVDKTAATKATVKLNAECRYEGRGNKAYKGRLSLDGFTGVGDTDPDSFLIPHAKTARRGFRYSGGASLNPMKVCGNELEKRLSQDASLTKYHLLAKGFSVKYPAAFRAQFYLTCKPTGLGFIDTSTKSANINAVIRCKASNLAKNKIPSSKPKPKRAPPKPKRATLKRISAGFVMGGASSELNRHRKRIPVYLAPGKKLTDVVGVGVAGSNDHVYVWYSDRTVSSGSTTDLAKHRKPYKYSLPPGKRPADIVGIGIAGSNDHVYAWYRDGTVSSGAMRDLARYRKPYRFTPSPTRAIVIRGMGIIGSNDNVYTLFGPRVR